MFGYAHNVINAKRMLTDNEVNEIKSFLKSKDKFELVMFRRGIIHIATDIEYHYDCYGVTYFFFALDNEIRSRNYYNLDTCKFFNEFDNALFECKVEAYQSEQRRKYEVEYYKGMLRYLLNNK